MKGRLLFALFFTLLIALGVHTLRQAQSARAALPPRRAAAVAALPAPQRPDDGEPPAAPRQSKAQEALPLPPAPVRSHNGTPLPGPAYYRAAYQLFRPDARAG